MRSHILQEGEVIAVCSDFQWAPIVTLTVVLEYEPRYGLDFFLGDYSLSDSLSTFFNTFSTFGVWI